MKVRTGRYSLLNRYKSWSVKLGIVFFYGCIALAIYWVHEPLLDWVEQATAIWILPIMGIATLMSLFPVIPYPLVGSVLGATFGPVLGGWMTWFGSSAASIIMFLFVRYGYQDWGQRVLYRYNVVGKFTDLFERNAFLAILYSRLIPVIPSIILNIYPALSRVSFPVYAIASSLGKVPAMFLFAVLGDQFVTEPRHMLVTVVTYTLFIVVTYWAYRWWKARRVRAES